MEDTKIKVFKGTSQIQAMGFKNALSEEAIPYYELDKSDSAYVGLFDEIQIYVDAPNEERALAVLKALNFQ